MLFVTVPHGPIVESHEGQLPGFTHRNPPAAISLKPLVLGIIATLLHPFPDSIKPGIPFPMPRPSLIPLYHLIPHETTTTLAHTTLEIILADLFDGPADAFTFS
jgi:hypothetical protein